MSGVHETGDDRGGGGSGGLPAAETVVAPGNPAPGHTKASHADSSDPGWLASQPSGRLVDLTLTLRRGQRGVDWETARTIERDGWNARTLHLYSHCGTHLDAPVHFAAGPETIDQMPLDRLMGPAWVVRIPNLPPRALIEIPHLGRVANQFQPGEGLLLHTGWSAHVDHPALYRDGLPRVSEALARWCVEHRVRILGVEPPSVADVNHLPEVTRIHKILLGGGVVIVEGLTNLDQLAGPKTFFAALPLKIEGGDGCPCRAFAVEGRLAGRPAAPEDNAVADGPPPRSR